MRDDGRTGADAEEANERLAAAVPTTAATVLQIGRGGGWLGGLLKRRRPSAVVYGADCAASTDDAAPTDDAVATDDAGLDRYHEIDLDRDVPPLAPGSVDCIVYADALP